MSTPSLFLRGDASVAGPWRTGVALSVTVAVFYALRTAVWGVAPRPFIGFMNRLFHGLDFSPLLMAAEFSWGGSLAALVVMAVWAFLAGTFYG